MVSRCILQPKPTELIFIRWMEFIFSHLSVFNWTLYFLCSLRQLAVISTHGYLLRIGGRCFKLAITVQVRYVTSWFSSFSCFSLLTINLNKMNKICWAKTMMWKRIRPAKKHVDPVDLGRRIRREHLCRVVRSSAMWLPVGRNEGVTCNGISISEHSSNRSFRKQISNQIYIYIYIYI